MINALFGKKIEQTQRFLTNGTRIPVTLVRVAGNTVMQQKLKDKNGYVAIQLGFGKSKKPTKALLGHSKKAGVATTPFFLGEIRVADEAELPAVGTTLNPLDVLKPGDIIDVVGVSKGKGFAGGVKRHHFKGGPRTHGQSDRERAPGSIGQTTTPGRVYKGKRMAGRMGHETVTVKNLQVVDVTSEYVFIKGLIPGSTRDKKAVVKLEKVGESKKFVALLKAEEPQPKAEVQETGEEPKKEEKPEQTKAAVAA